MCDVIRTYQYENPRNPSVCQCHDIDEVLYFTGEIDSLDKPARPLSCRPTAFCCQPATRTRNS